MTEAGQFKFCTECGTKLNADAKFCTNCGAKCAPLGAAAPQAEPVPPPGQEAFMKGQQYFLGEGTEQNFEEAQKHFAEAAKAGHIEAPIWQDMCRHYREIMQLSQRAEAVRNGLTPQEAAVKYPSVMGESVTKSAEGGKAAAVVPASEAAKPAPGTVKPQESPESGRMGGTNHNEGQRNSRKRLGTLGKIAAGAAVGAVAMNLFRGSSSAHGGVFGHNGMNSDYDAANQSYDDSTQTADDTVYTENDTDYVDTNTAYDDTVSNESYDDSSASYDDTGNDASYDDGSDYNADDSSDYDSGSDDYDSGDSGDWDSGDSGSDDW